MIAWILDRAKERSTWMGIFLFAVAGGLTVTPKHKKLVITTAVAVVAAVEAMTRDKFASE